MTADIIVKTSAKHKKIAAVLALCLVAAGGLAYLRARQDTSATPDFSGAAFSSGDGSLAAEPDREADIYGMVTSIKGNQITIMKFDPATMPGAKKSGSGAGSEEEAVSENAISLGTSNAMSGPGGKQGGPPSGGGMPGDRGGGGSSSAATTTRESKLEELKADSIGTETVTVPVGIPILVQSSSANNSEAAVMEMGTIRDLTSDTVVILWLKPEDGDGDEVTRSAAYVNVTGKVDMDNSTN